jgi:hypothetical protein
MLISVKISLSQIRHPRPDKGAFVRGVVAAVVVEAHHIAQRIDSLEPSPTRLEVLIINE